MPAQPQAGLSNEAVISAGTQRGERTAAGAMAEYKVRDDLLEGRVQDRLSSKCNSLEEDLERRAPAKPLAGPVVDQIQNALKFRL